MDKTKGVMTALKGRTGFGSKKGVNLLGIVQKLTAKREAMKNGDGGPGVADRPALPSQAKVPSKILPEQAKGKPKGRPFM